MITRIVFLFLVITSSLAGQELKLIKANQQIINQGASPRSTTNYTVLIKKEKAFKWSIDSIVNVYIQKSISYNIVKVDNPNAISPDYKQVKSFLKSDKGLFQITFSAVKNRGTGRSGTPMNLQVPVSEFTQGAIVYYRVGTKKKQLFIESFEVLETLNAP